MTDHSRNGRLQPSSVMQGHNAAYIEQICARYANDPDAVGDAWQAFFMAMGDDEVSVKHEAEGPSWARTDWPQQPADAMMQSHPERWKAQHLYPQTGHLPLAKRGGSGGVIPRRPARGTPS